MDQAIACPNADVLNELMQGKLDDPQLSQLASHLEACPSCQEIAKTLSSHDTLSDSLRADTASADDIARAIPRPLVEKLKALASRRGIGESDTVGFSGGAPEEPIDLTFLAPAQRPDEMGRLGAFRILKILGKGGMGMVFLADDPELERNVALKVMLPKIAANPSAKQRFLREARAAAKLHSDHIVTIHHVGEDRGIPYQSMQLLDGMPLDQLLNKGKPIPLAEAMRIGREIAQGLAVAHEKGMIHRDIKPSNLWLEPKDESAVPSFLGRVKILDFGLAKKIDEDIHLTHSGAIVGTPTFMAPEQARGEKVDARADLFSLGCVLYRLCVGDIPFRGETTMGVLLALAMNDPTPPVTIDSRIPQALSELIMKLLEKDAGKRPASAHDVVARLQEIEKTVAGNMPTDATNIERSLSFPPMAKAISEPGLQTALEQAKAEPKPSAPPRKRPPIGFGAMVLLGLLFLGGGGIFALLQMGVIRFSNDQGDYVIATDDPDFAFSVSKGSVVLEDRKTKRKYNLKVVGGNKVAGEHEIEVTDVDADLAFKTKNFTIKRGQEVALKAWFERKQVAVVEPPIAPAGRYALEVAFDPASYVEVVGDIVDFARPFTWECYVQSEKLLAHNFAYPIRTTGGNLLIDHREIGFNIGTDKEIQRIGQGKLSDRPTHLAGVFTGTRMRIFMDGRLMAEEESRSNLKTKERILHIGMRFTGRIWEVRLSKTARYDKDFTPAQRFDPDADTLALYHFDEGKGDVLKDSSGNGHHGKIIGAKWVKVGDAPSLDPDRRAAEYVLSVGGILGYAAGPYEIFHVDQLPKTNRVLDHVFLRNNPRVTDAALEVFRNCTGLSAIDFDGSPVGDEALSHFGHLKNLRYVNVQGSKVKDAGLAHLKDCKKLIELAVGGTAVTDAGLAHFTDCKDLRRLLLNGTGVTDDGVAQFKDCKQMTHLLLEQTAITDKTLEFVAGFPKLSHLHVKKTKTTDAALKKVAAALPLCRIEWDGGVFEPRVTAEDPDVRAAQYVILMGGTVGSERAFDIGVVGELHDQFRLTYFVLKNNAKATDAGFANLKGCKNLTGVYTAGLSVGNAAIAYFEDSKALLDLEVAGSNVTDAGLVHLKKFAKLRHLSLAKTQVTDDAATHIKLCETLESLNLEQTAITDKSLEAFHGLTKLSKLHLKKTKVTEAGVRNLAVALPKCKIEWDKGVIDPAANLDPDRRAAEYVLSLGGEVHLNEQGEVLKAGAELPRDKFRLTYVDLQDKTTTEAGMAAFQGCTNLKTLVLRGAQVTDASLAYFKDCKNLTHLDFRGAKIGDAGLAHFKDCKDLIGIELDFTLVTDLGLAHWKDCKHLTQLSLTGLNVSNTGLGYFKDNFKNLQSLYLARSQVTDAGVADFKDCKNLLHLSLSDTQVSDGGAANFKGCKELITLHLEGTKVSNLGLANFKDCKKITSLFLGNTRVTDEGLVHFKDCNLGQLNLNGLPVTSAGLAHLKASSNLWDLSLHGTKMSDAGSSVFKEFKNLEVLVLSQTEVSDAVVAHIKDCKKLRDLRILKTKISQAGFDELKKAFPGCKIEWDGSVVGRVPRDPTGFHAVRAMPPDEWAIAHSK